MSKPLVFHWLVVKCVLRYLTGIIYHGVVFKPSPQLILQGFFDVDLVSYPNDIHSILGLMLYYDANSIRFSSIL